MGAHDPFAFRGFGDIYVTHHSPRCPVVRFSALGATTLLEREYCSCGAFHGRYSRDHLTFSNIVTTAGARFYMQQITNGSFTSATPTVASITTDFSTMEMSNAGAGVIAAPAVGNDRSTMSSIISGSQQLATSGYPRVSDPDADNTATVSDDVLTWSFSYTAASFSATGISDVWITKTAPGASEPIATHFDESSFTPSGVFNKTSSDTLKFIYNVTGAGA